MRTQHINFPLVSREHHDGALFACRINHLSLGRRPATETVIILLSIHLLQDSSSSMSPMRDTTSHLQRYY